MSDGAPMVLAIDDSTMVLDLVESLLGEAGFRVARATSGAEGLRVARELEPDVILLDVQMPDSDGWDVCRALKGDAGTAPIPVLFMTGERTGPEDVVRGLELGAVDYITKPFHGRVLVQRVTTALHGYQVQRELRRLADARAEALAALANAQLHGSEAQRRMGGARAAARATVDIASALTEARARLELARARAGAPGVSELIDEALADVAAAARLVDRLREVGEDREATTSVTDIARAVLLPMAETLRRRGVEVAMDLDDTPPVRDAARLAPVVSELVANAARAIDGAGRVEVSTRAEGGWILLEVTDDGPGLGPEAASREVTPEALGLPMCRAIVESLGGAMAIASGGDRGTRVRVRVPARR